MQFFTLRARRFARRAAPGQPMLPKAQYSSIVRFAFRVATLHSVRLDAGPARLAHTKQVDLFLDDRVNLISLLTDRDPNTGVGATSCVSCPIGTNTSGPGAINSSACRDDFKLVVDFDSFPSGPGDGPCEAPQLHWEQVSLSLHLSYVTKPL